MNEKQLNDIYSPPYGTEFHGPFRGGWYTMSVHGYKVPYLRIYKRGDTDTEWTVQIDERIEVDVDDMELRRFGPILFNAMALAAGFTAGGENSADRNVSLFNCQIAVIAPFELDEISGDDDTE